MTPASDRRTSVASTVGSSEISTHQCWNSPHFVPNAMSRPVAKDAKASGTIAHHTHG